MAERKKLAIIDPHTKVKLGAGQAQFEVNHGTT